MVRICERMDTNGLLCLLLPGHHHDRVLLDRAISHHEGERTMTESHPTRSVCQFCSREYTHNMIRRHERSCPSRPDGMETGYIITTNIPSMMRRKLEGLVSRGDFPNRSEAVRHAISCLIEGFYGPPPAPRAREPVNVAAWTPRVGHGYMVCAKCGCVVSSRWGCKRCMK